MTTHSKGWNDDFSSDDPEHARKQREGLTVETLEEMLAEVPDEAWDAAPATGPDPRQPEMVSREKYDTLHEACRAALVALPPRRNPHPDDALQRLVNLAYRILEDALEDAKL